MDSLFDEPAQVDFAADIPLDLAARSHAGTSFVPEQRAQQERDGYAETLRTDYAEILKLIAGKPELVITLDTEFARYREGYRKHTCAHLAAKSHCISTMITGGSNFPVRRAEKANQSEHNRLNELVEFRKRALEAIRRTLCPELRPIMSGDADAVQRLTDDILAAENKQGLMKQVNSAIRTNKGRPAQIVSMVALGLSEALATELVAGGRFCGDGYASFELSNNSANIRRMKQRLEVIKRNKATPDTTTEGTNARIEDCPSENRVRLFFPGKPDAQIRETLKGAGFRWTPSLGCWQAYRNYRTLEIATKTAS